MEFTASEIGVMAGLVRAAIRKGDSGRAHQIQKYGEKADLTAINGRLELLESIYRKLGKDPRNIASRGAA